jgi:hypothetical protein
VIGWWEIIFAGLIKKKKKRWFLLGFVGRRKYKDELLLWFFVGGYGWPIYTVGAIVGCWQWILEKGKREQGSKGKLAGAREKNSGREDWEKIIIINKNNI